MQVRSPVGAARRPRVRPAMVRPLRELPAGLRRAVLVLLWAGGIGIASHAVLSATGVLGPTGDVILSGWGQNVLLFIAAGLAVARAATVARERVAWSFIAAALVVWAVGEVYWWERVMPLDPAPYPSFADACWIAFFPLMYTGLVLLVRARASRFPRALWSDAVIGALGIGSASAAFVLRPVLETSGLTTAGTLTNLAYPVGDLVLFALVLWAVGLTGWRVGMGWGSLAAGIALACVADSIFLVRVADGTYEVGTILDSLWPAGFLAIGAAAWAPSEHRAPVHISGWAASVVPSGFAALALAITNIDDFVEVGHIAQWLATATLVTALIRGALSLRESRLFNETRRLALTDELTSLPNRRAFHEALEGALSEAGRDGGTVAVLLMDLDRFKEVNDTLGHLAGDDLLRVVAHRLGNTVRDTSVVARLGGDEFVILARVSDEDEATALATRLNAAIAETTSIQGLGLRVESSIGVALFPHHGAESDELLRCADIAMYIAKADGHGVRLYDPAIDVHSPERLGLMTELGQAIAHDQLVLHYQPKLDLGHGGRVLGAEVLVRWQHPSRGLLAPGEFIEIAEATALMRPLTLHILDRALKQTRRWRDERNLDVKIAVNLSARCLLDPELPDDVDHLLRKWDVPADRLELEITETALMAHPGLALEVLGRLHDLGVSLAIDDFGVGYSSLSYLKQLPVDVLKIDRSFVQGLEEESPQDAAIVHSTVELAKTLGLMVVAEGVETEPVLDRLTSMGCHSAQGYLVSRPVAADDFADWIEDFHADSAVVEGNAVAWSA